MLPEVLNFLKPERGGVFVDGTLGGGGHSEGILKLLPEASRLYGIDRDGEAIEAAGARLKNYPAFTAIRGNFFQMEALLAGFNVKSVDGILLDLGVSSHQFDKSERGFSYSSPAKPDMRMDRSQPLSAYEVVNGYTQKALYEIIRDYGEERFASRIAANIVKAREISPIESAAELAEIIKGAIPAAARRGGGHPAKRTFQALRIEVNDEIKGLDEAIASAFRLLKPGGVIAVISFHSLEDRIVKNVFKRLENPCICPKDAPVCVCGRKPEAEILTKKPLIAGEAELAVNKRAKSAKLRAAKRLII